ncbi:MAG: Gfo/Idh/MocA family oxidoreductase [Planctomycetes bacterium]|nr:Gfo/Idh/MocA family oxidoreductase [Planctomycetota bacterium]
MVNVGLIGCGQWGSELIRVFHEGGRSNVTAVCDTDIGRLNVIRGRFPAAETFTEWRELLTRDDLTLIVVATPLDSHYAIAREAIRHGKHVLVETPFTRDAAQAEELVELANREGVLLAVDFTSLLSPEIQYVREMIETGALGELNFVDSLRTSIGSIERQADVMLDLASHELAMIEFVTGRGANGVLATGSCHAESGQVDVAYINLDYGDGMMANIHVNRLVPVQSQRLMIGGSQKTIVMDDLFANGRILVYQGEASDVEAVTNGSVSRSTPLMIREGDVLIPKLSSQDTLAAVAQHVTSAITQGTSLIIDGRLGHSVMRILELCQRSLYQDFGQVLKETSAPVSSILRTASKEAAGIASAPGGVMNLAGRDSMIIEPEVATQSAVAP